MSISDIRAIDVHAHIGTYYRGVDPLLDSLCSGDCGVVQDRAAAAGVEATFVSSLPALMPRGDADPIGGNAGLAQSIQDCPGIYQWVVVDPTKPETFEQATEILESPRCVGVKIHPEEHCYPITEHAERIFSIAAERGAIIQSHSGEENSLPGDFVPFADRYPSVTLIISHLGHSADGDLSHQVRAIAAARHGNMYTDTSSAKSIHRGLLEWAVGEIGSERIMMGTDSPLYDAPMHRGRINGANLPDRDKQMILRENALRIFASTLKDPQASS